MLATPRFRLQALWTFLLLSLALTAAVWSPGDSPAAEADLDLADGIPPLPEVDAEIESRADLIALGEVTAQVTNADADIWETLNTVTVIHLYKGAPADTFKVRSWGGEEDGIVQEIEHNPRLSLGTVGFMFVEALADGNTFGLVEGERGFRALTGGEGGSADCTSTYCLMSTSWNGDALPVVMEV